MGDSVGTVQSREGRSRSWKGLHLNDVVGEWSEVRGHGEEAGGV